jgi:hypothetical protein
MRSNSDARAKHAATFSSLNTSPSRCGSSFKPTGTTDASRPGFAEFPLANKVTSRPRAAMPRAISEATCSHGP